MGRNDDTRRRGRVSWHQLQRDRTCCKTLCAADSLHQARCARASGHNASTLARAGVRERHKWHVIRTLCGVRPGAPGARSLHKSCPTPSFARLPHQNSSEGFKGVSRNGFFFGLILFRYVGFVPDDDWTIQPATNSPTLWQTCVEIW